MRNNRRRRAAFEEPSYWQSFSDMMAALLLIFILIIAITLMIYRQKTTDLEQTELELNAAQLELNAAQLELNAAQLELDNAKLNLEQSRQEIEASNKELADSLAELQIAYDKAATTQEELNAAYLEIENAKAELAAANQEMETTKAELDATRSELQDIVGIRTDIIGELQATFNNSSMSVDAQTGSITFSSDVLFSNNSYMLTGESKESLREVIPLYLDVLLQDNYRPYIAEIIIEGHTDTNSGYQLNMDLSYNRANAVAKFCMDKKNGLSEEKIEQLQQLLTVNGRSYSDPIYKEGTDEVDMAASRRVEIKFRLKEDEMIEKIAQILNQG
ncbi:MAG: OmpA family protein [Lachnospiraceae bacterium]|nr:OmpA family protein [Lachnospiraceae bacterium]